MRGVAAAEPERNVPALRRIWRPEKEGFRPALVTEVLGGRPETIRFPWEGWIWEVGGPGKTKTRLAVYPEQKMARAQFVDCFDEPQIRQRLIHHIGVVPLDGGTLLSVVSCRGNRYSTLSVAQDGSVSETHGTRPVPVDVGTHDNGLLLADEASGPVLSVNEAATRLGVHRTTVQRLAREGALKAVKRGWHLFIHVDSLEELKRSRR